MICKYEVFVLLSVLNIKVYIVDGRNTKGALYYDARVRVLMPQHK